MMDSHFLSKDIHLCKLIMNAGVASGRMLSESIDSLLNTSDVTETLKLDIPIDATTTDDEDQEIAPSHKKAKIVVNSSGNDDALDEDYSLLAKKELALKLRKSLTTLVLPSFMVYGYAVSTKSKKSCGSKYSGVSIVPSATTIEEFASTLFNFIKESEQKHKSTIMGHFIFIMPGTSNNAKTFSDTRLTNTIVSSAAGKKKSAAAAAVGKQSHLHVTVLCDTVLTDDYIYGNYNAPKTTKIVMDVSFNVPVEGVEPDIVITYDELASQLEEASKNQNALKPFDRSTDSLWVIDQKGLCTTPYQKTNSKANFLRSLPLQQTSAIDGDYRLKIVDINPSTFTIVHTTPGSTIDCVKTFSHPNVAEIVLLRSSDTQKNAKEAHSVGMGDVQKLESMVATARNKVVSHLKVDYLKGMNSNQTIIPTQLYPCFSKNVDERSKQFDSLVAAAINETAPSRSHPAKQVDVESLIKDITQFITSLSADTLCTIVASHLGNHTQQQQQYQFPPQAYYTPAASYVQPYQGTPCWAPQVQQPYAFQQVPYSQQQAPQYYQQQSNPYQYPQVSPYFLPTQQHFQQPVPCHVLPSLTSRQQQPYTPVGFENHWRAQGHLQQQQYDDHAHLHEEDSKNQRDDPDASFYREHANDDHEQHNDECASLHGEHSNDQQRESV